MKFSGLLLIKAHFKYAAAALFCAVMISGCQTVPQSNPEEIEIFHTNDMHSHFAGNKDNSACLRESGCTGGYGAAALLVAQARKSNPDALFLDAGDKFQGSLLYVNYRSPLVSQIDNLMGYNAATFGNHEFDEGCQKLLDFVQKANYPFLAANLKPEDGCPLKNDRIQPYEIREYRGQKIGLIGLSNPDVVGESSACSHTKFIDPIEAVRNSVQELETQGVKIIIVISHLGLPFDKRLGKTVRGVDIIVGGHTHDYIGPGSPLGSFPIVEKAPDGKPVLIVTTSGEANYLGHLKVAFDRNGTAKNWSGEPMKLGIAGGSPDITKVINQAADSIEQQNSAVIGENQIRDKDGLDACREGDCLSAALVSRAMLDYAKRKGAEIALINGGSFRGALPVGKITEGDLDNIQPFKDVLEIREYTGRQIAEAVEHGVSDLDGIGPRILQPAGLRYSYRPTAAAYHRVASVEVQNRKGRWEPINPRQKYIVAVNTFLGSGGDHHAALGNGRLIDAPNVKIPEIFAKWIARHTPLIQAPEARIRQLP